MIEFDEGLMAYILFWLAVLGTVAGSTICCVSGRLAVGEDPIRGRSHCDACGHTLGAVDLIPIFSYLFHKGRCRYCGSKIPPDCLLSEILGAGIFLGLGLKFGVSPELLMWLIFGCILYLLAYIDARTMLLPDKLLLAAILNRLIFVVILQQPWKATLISMLIGACSVSLPLLLLVLLMDRILGKETMGGGDIKLLFVMGLYLDWMQMVLLLLVAAIVALIFALLRQKQQRSAPLAFGPFLALAGMLVIFFGDPLLDWYRMLLY
jgi:prepilin signal peptidase PulO-like enzyme (type II secretory pathway)